MSSQQLTQLPDFRQQSRELSLSLQYFPLFGSFTAHAFAAMPLSLKDYFDLIKESIKVWIHLKGEPPKEVMHQQDNSTKIVNMDGQIYYANSMVVNIISDAKAGKAAEQFIGKSLEEGISHLAIKSSTLKDSTTVEKKDAAYFKPVDIKNLV